MSLQYIRCLSMLAYATGTLGGGGGGGVIERIEREEALGQRGEEAR